jgi:5-methylcytosine-specific restriction endonuclease McrA
MASGVYVRTEKHRKILSEVAKKSGRVPPSRRGIPNSPEQRLKISKSLKGIKHSEESIKQRAKTNRENHDRNGRKTHISQLIRSSVEYKLWRMSVLERDKFTCRFCGIKGGWSKEMRKKIDLNADHIKPFAYFPELRFAIDNGRTLCAECHMKTDTYGSKAFKHKRTD